MNDDQAAKVIQFPGKQKETTGSSRNETPGAAPIAVAAPIPTPAPQKKVRANFGAALGILAVVLATVAVNRFAYRGEAQSSRGIASAKLELDRDAAWEKSLAERLAKPGALRSVAQVGRRATLAEQMRFETLEDKYAIDWRPGQTLVAGVRANGQPLVIDRAGFLKKYGQLFDTSFASAKLADASNDRGHRVETYELNDRGGQVLGRASFEYDEHQGLVSMVTVQK